MRLFQSAGSLPLGVDFRNGSLSIVALEERAHGVDIREAGTVAIPAFDETIVDLRVAQAVRELLATFSTHERRCVLAAPAGEVVCRPFHLSPGTRRAEAYRAAALEADVLAPWPAAERSVSLDPLPNLDGAMLLSVARRGPPASNPSPWTFRAACGAARWRAPMPFSTAGASGRRSRSSRNRLDPRSSSLRALSRIASQVRFARPSSKRGEPV